MKYLITLIFKIKETEKILMFQKFVDTLPILPTGTKFLADGFPSAPQFPGLIKGYTWSEGCQIEVIIEGCEQVSTENATFLEKCLCPQYKIWHF